MSEKKCAVCREHPVTERGRTCSPGCRAELKARTSDVTIRRRCTVCGGWITKGNRYGLCQRTAACVAARWQARRAWRKA